MPLSKKDKEGIVDLLKTAKKESNNSMPIIVHMPSKECKDFAEAAMKGRRGFKHVSLIISRTEPA